MREMKDSGIEWIGEIPYTWGTSRMKYIGPYMNGFAFKPEQWGPEGKRIIRIQDLTKSAEKSNYFSGTIDPKYNVTAGDILVSWAATLDAFIWDKEDGWLNQHIFKATPIETQICREYFFWLIKEAMQNMNNDNKHGIMMQHVTLDVFNNFAVPLPPATEQQKLQIVSTASVPKLMLLSSVRRRPLKNTRSLSSLLPRKQSPRVSAATA